MRGEKKINKPIKINKHNGRLNSTGRVGGREGGEGGRGGRGKGGGREEGEEEGREGRRETYVYLSITSPHRPHVNIPRTPSASPVTTFAPPYSHVTII